MVDSEIILEVLDRANESVSEWFLKYCFDNDLTPKEVCVSVKAKGIKKHFVSQLFSENLPPCASPCGDGIGGETKKETPNMKKKPTVKKPTAAKVAAKPAPAKKSAKKSAKK